MYKLHAWKTGGRLANISGSLFKGNPYLVAPEINVWRSLVNPEIFHYTSIKTEYNVHWHAGLLYVNRSCLPKLSINVSTPGPLLGGTTVPSGKIAGDGDGSNCLDKSQY